tara:strand:+ start:9208 stop:9423 length:216 start_codon:yes stop_codon:yes gene_type:complete
MKKDVPNELVVEFITNEGVKISMLKKNNKYHILITSDAKKNKAKRIHESLDVNVSRKKFFSICNYYTKDIN